MADYGLLAGLGEGLKAGIGGYQDARRLALEQAANIKNQEHQDFMEKMALSNSGLAKSDQGELVKTPEQLQKESLEGITTQAGIVKGGQKAVLNPATNKYDLQPIPGYRDVENEYKKAMIDLTKAKTKSEGQPAPVKPPTSDQSKVAIFADRLNQSEKVFNDLAGQGYNRASAGSSAEAGMSKIPLIGGLLSGKQGEQTKMQDQAERNFVNAVLRRESGAAISPSEFESAEKQYFPRLGDTPAVLAQKAENRRSELAGFQAEAGNALGLLKEQKPFTPETVLPKKKGLMKDVSAGAAQAGNQASVGAVPPPEKRPVGLSAKGADGVTRFWNGQGWQETPTQQAGR
jgi:hypothetical protein